MNPTSLLSEWIVSENNFAVVANPNKTADSWQQTKLFLLMSSSKLFIITSLPKVLLYLTKESQTVDVLKALDKYNFLWISTFQINFFILNSFQTLLAFLGIDPTNIIWYLMIYMFINKLKLCNKLHSALRLLFNCWEDCLLVDNKDNSTLPMWRCDEIHFVTRQS